MTTAGAERIRRFRQRKRDGTVVVPLKIHAEAIADLVALGWLHAGATRSEVHEGFLRFVEQAFDNQIRPPHVIEIVRPTAPTLGDIWQRHQIG